MVLYMEVTKDKYELPLFVADSIKELSQHTGISACRISSIICHGEDVGRHSSRFVRVIIDDNDIDE